VVAGPMEVRVSFTIAEHGRDPDNGERFMEAFMERFPEGGPSVSQNLKEGTLTVTFALDAEDANAGVKEGIQIFVDAWAATELPASRILDVEASVVDAETGEHAEVDAVPA
jgi:hypothetical protein